ncbi:SDR family oxidoreductase [Utexia brackfieldae]|uniref:SDR family oxidoreductase n=1 Tax=Utexia brackfieldae TaxID=3074108 RepID=UPI00370D7C08
MKSIFITGCSSGIGFVAAQALRTRGYHVITACRQPVDYQKLVDLGFDCVLLDLDDPNSVERAAKEVLAFCHHQLFGLFNNAGFGVYGAIMSISRAKLEAQFSTNFFGMHQLTQLLLPAMLSQQDARIIQTSSIMGFISTPGRGAYAASKYALEAWSDALRLELKETCIKVCLLEPGPIETAFTHNVNQMEQGHIVENPPLAKHFALPPEAILPKLYHALEKSSPKIRYRITLITQVTAILKRLLPDKLMDRVLKRK